MLGSGGDVGAEVWGGRPIFHRRVWPTQVGFVLVSSRLYDHLGSRLVGLNHAHRGRNFRLVHQGKIRFVLILQTLEGSGGLLLLYELRGVGAMASKRALVLRLFYTRRRLISLVIRLSGTLGS